MICAAVLDETQLTPSKLVLAAFEDGVEMKTVETVPPPHLPELQNACARALLSLDSALPGGVIAVVSAGSSDGRAVAAAGVALAVAELTEGPVALVELDFVNPQQARIFGATQGDGLAGLLGGGERLPVTAVATGSPLFLMPAGPPSGWSSRSLNSVIDRRLVPALVRHFRWTVIDLPAIMEDSAALAIARLASLRIVVVRHRVTGRRSLQTVLTTLDGDEVPTVLLLRGKPLGLPSWFRKLHGQAQLYA